MGKRTVQCSNAGRIPSLPPWHAESLFPLRVCRVSGSRRWLKILFALGLLWLASALWQAWKPLPPGVDMTGPWRAAQEVSFLTDLTFVDQAGRRHSEQTIFDAAFAMIAQADSLVVLDMFLFNDFGAAPDQAPRPLSAELTDALLERMAQVPGLRVIVITDPINTVYGGVVSSHLERLRLAGAQVIQTDLAALRAS